MTVSIRSKIRDTLNNLILKVTCPAALTPRPFANPAHAHKHTGPRRRW